MMAKIIKGFDDNKRNKLNETMKVVMKETRNILDGDEKKGIQGQKPKEHQKRRRNLPADIKAEIKEKSSTNQ